MPVACCFFFFLITLWSLETMKEISMDFPLRPQTKTFGKKREMGVLTGNGLFFMKNKNLSAKSSQPNSLLLEFKNSLQKLVGKRLSLDTDAFKVSSGQKAKMEQRGKN